MGVVLGVFGRNLVKFFAKSRLTTGRLLPATALAAVSVCVYFAVISSPSIVRAQSERPDVNVEVQETNGYVTPDDLFLRARVTAMTPKSPVKITWHHGGQGLGGVVVGGGFASAVGKTEMELGGSDGESVAVGEWTAKLSIKALAHGKVPGRLFVTMVATPVGGRAAVKNVVFEFEFSYKGKVIKTFKEAAPDGPTATILIPANLVAGKTPEELSKSFIENAKLGDKAPDDFGKAFIEKLTGLEAYVVKRAETLEALPWAAWPLPRKFAFVNDIGGYGEGYGGRHTNKAIVEAECRSLHQLGVNGFRGGPRFLMEAAGSGTGFAKDFNVSHMGGAGGGYPLAQTEKGHEPPPDAGCPYGAGVAQRSAEAVERGLRNLSVPVGQVWALTVDEIGSAVRAHHVANCPKCAEAFRGYLKDQGLTPADFGKTEWSEVAKVKPPSDESAAPAAGKAKAPAGKKAKGGKGAKPAPAAAAPDEPGQAISGDAGETKALDPEVEEAPDIVSSEPIDYTDRATALLAYHRSMFCNIASAKLFSPMKDSYDKLNQAKAKALADGKADSPTAKQPWVYTYALRGNTFLMGGGSLDFFDFYRYADNGFCYETSNRDPRIWSWDSYLCDVGRSVKAHMDKAFGIYVKPHRGAPVQRALSSISRGATMIYWYTYGPDYSKGDCYSQNPAVLQLVSKAAHLIGKTEDVLYGAKWMVPAEVAVVNPRTSELWMHLAGGPAGKAYWENAKWTYTALAHAHVPVDALDETMLASEDLSHYKAIYISGPNLRADVAAKIAKWVEAGGILYTSGGGLARDEANAPLKALQPALGLLDRSAVDMYYQISLYGAVSIQSFGDARHAIAAAPAGAQVICEGGPAGPAGKFMPVVGRETLNPGGATKVLAKFADGKAALTCSTYGKGKVYVAGFFGGLEYSAAVRGGQWDMSSSDPGVGFDPLRRALVACAALDATRPVVDASMPTVEGILLKNDANSKRAVTLMNWAYKAAQGKRGVVTAENLTVRVRGCGPVSKATSAMLDKTLEVSVDKTASDVVIIKLPTLDEGDVLLLD